MGQQQHSDVIIALRRQLNGKDAQGRDQWIRHGDLIPQATNWDRIMHATERGDFLRLTPAACEAICEAAGITDRLRSLEARIKELSKK